MLQRCEVLLLAQREPNDMVLEICIVQSCDPRPRVNNAPRRSVSSFNSSKSAWDRRVSIGTTIPRPLEAHILTG